MLSDVNYGHIKSHLSTAAFLIQFPCLFYRVFISQFRAFVEISFGFLRASKNFDVPNEYLKRTLVKESDEKIFFLRTALKIHFLRFRNVETIAENIP